LARKRPERLLPAASPRLVNPAVNGTTVAAGFGFAPVESGLGVLPLNAPLADNDFVSV
jgi:hypothetical protein